MANAPKGPEIAAAGTYLVERYWPGVTREELLARIAQAMRCAEEMRSAGEHIRYLETMLIPSQDSVLCLIEADGPDLVAALNRRADLPFDRISRTDKLGLAAFERSGGT